jgi:hypothetical protein
MIEHRFLARHLIAFVVTRSVDFRIMIADNQTVIDRRQSHQLPGSPHVACPQRRHPQALHAVYASAMITWSVCTLRSRARVLVSTYHKLPTQHDHAARVGAGPVKHRQSVH